MKYIHLLLALFLFSGIASAQSKQEKEILAATGQLKMP
jgi:hypothetical protein